jgi:hypothetical protein
VFTKKKSNTGLQQNDVIVFKTTGSKILRRVLKFLESKLISLFVGHYLNGRKYKIVAIEERNKIFRITTARNIVKRGRACSGKDDDELRNKPNGKYSENREDRR